MTRKPNNDGRMVITKGRWEAVIQNYTSETYLLYVITSSPTGTFVGQYPAKTDIDKDEFPYLYYDALIDTAEVHVEQLAEKDLGKL